MKNQTLVAIGALLLVLIFGSVLFTVVRILSEQGLHAFQLVFFYNAVALVLLLPIVLNDGLASLKTTRRPMKFYCLRAVFEFAAFSLSFYALTLIPLPTHTAISFMTPLFATLIAVLFMREHSTVHTWMALLTGFSGMLLITRPGMEGGAPAGGLVMLMAALVFGMCGPVIKVLTRTEAPNTIAFYMLSLTMLISIPFAASVWVMPEGSQWGWIFLIGALSLGQQILIAIALKNAPIPVLMPFNFVSLILSSLLAYFVFHELIDVWTLLGAVIIIISSIYNTVYATKKPHIDGPPTQV